MAFRAETFVFEGGLDLETSYLQLPKGRLIDCLNYECPPRGGYRRIDGYSLHDGSASPAAVPGEGEIRGVWIYQEELYAFRDQATEGGMFRATATGWQAVDLGKSLLSDRLDRLSLTVHPSAANFLLVNVADATVWHNKLMRLGLFVRDCTSFGLPQHIRIGIRSMSDCQRLIEAMETVSFQV